MTQNTTIRIFRQGPHAHRTPLGYPALAGLFEGRLEHVDQASAADIYVFAHILDVQQAPRDLVTDWRVRRRPVVILSEEPFWDTVWGRRPLARNRVVDTHFGAVPVIQLNHHTSAIFDFDAIPYYLLTNHRFASAYAARFARLAEVSPARWQDRFAARAVDLTFMFERRPEPFHALNWPEGDIQGLCAWRTELAERCQSGRVERLGQSWDGGESRFQLENWHLDKLLRLDDRARIQSAIENTHQPGYITEKLFDAFACGSLPLYVAGPGHRVHEFGLPPASWINLWGMSPEAAARRIAAQTWDRPVFDAYAAAQCKLAARFGDPNTWVAERTRLARSLYHELQQILASAPPEGVPDPFLSELS